MSNDGDIDMDHHDLERLSRLYRAMGDPTRLRILGLLAEQEATGQDLSERLGLTPPTISHHMAKLVEAGLVLVTPQAQRRLYRLNLDALRPSPPIGNAQTPGSSADDASSDDDAKTIRSFFDGERLKTIPASRKKRVVILRYLLGRFEPGRAYPEREVNDLLRRAHDDVATLRRELVDYGFMTREAGVYRLGETPPARGATVAQEVGPDETAWFASLVARATNDALSRREPRP
jgi:biotin operon repressor